MTIFAYIDVLSVETLGLSTMTTTALRYGAGIETIGELRQKNLKELLTVPGIGKKGVRSIAEVLRHLTPSAHSC